MLFFKKFTQLTKKITRPPVALVAPNINSALWKSHIALLLLFLIATTADFSFVTVASACFLFLASQDAIEVMPVTYSLLVSIDLTDVTLVSDDT